MPKKREPGLKIPLPDKDFKPNASDPLYREGAGRRVLEHAQSLQSVQDFGAPRDSWASQSPASPTFGKGRPGKEPERSEEQQGISIQLGIKRQ